jgi:hypothetical protein
VSVEVACKEVMREVGGNNDCIAVLYEDRLSYRCITIGYYKLTTIRDC